MKQAQRLPLFSAGIPRWLLVLACLVLVVGYLVRKCRPGWKRRLDLAGTLLLTLLGAVYCWLLGSGMCIAAAEYGFSGRGIALLAVLGIAMVLVIKGIFRQWRRWLCQREAGG